MRDFLNYAEARQLARRRLPRGLFDYIDRGTEDEKALSRNREALDAVRIRPRALTGGGARNQSVSLFGQTLRSPIIVAPTALAGFVWYKGEAELAKAAGDAGIPFNVSTQGIASVEELSRVGAGPIWFQLYMVGEDEQLPQQMAQRAWDCGVRTLVVTIDMPLSANREYNTRNGFGVPFKYSLRNLYDLALHPRWTLGVIGRYLAAGTPPMYANFPPSHRYGLLGGVSKAPGLMSDVGWDHMRRLRDFWKGNLVLKGILRADDAVQAADIGADGIVVSSHGGRRLDSAVSPIEVLPEIVDAVGHRITVMADSGVQRGSDILKLLAIGARAVMIGRGMLYGTAVDGVRGAGKMIDIYQRELDTSMAMSGCRHIRELGRDILEMHSGPALGSASSLA